MILTEFLTNERERNRFLKFAVVGVIGAVVDFGTFNILSGLLNVNPVLASVMSFIAAIISNFSWNRFWTYPDSRSKTASRQMIQFLIVSIVGLGIRTPLFALLQRTFGAALANAQFLPAGKFTAEFVSHNLALACAVVVVMFWNFFVNRFWTYNDIDG